MPRGKSIENRLDGLDDVLAEPDRAAQLERLEAALADRHYRIVAKAARLAAERLLYELEPQLIAAYRRRLDNVPKSDPSCFAKKAIAHALVELDSTDETFLLEGLAYRQPEPVWGGTKDTAADVRASCAVGLVGAGYPRALVEIASLLYDPEPDARIGAVRAIACGNPREAEALLRSRVLSGDTEPAVIGECFSGLLRAEPDESLDFVARYLLDQSAAVRELSALALGESRLELAVDRLKAAWDDVLPPPGFRRVLIRAAAVHRSDAAFDWLVSIVANADASLATDALESLAIYKRNTALTERLEAALGQRGDGALHELFAELWRSAS